MALAVAAPFAWAQVSQTTTTTTTTEGGGTITEYTPASMIVLKETNGPRTYHLDKTVTYVTQFRRVSNRTERIPLKNFAKMYRRFLLGAICRWKCRGLGPTALLTVVVWLCSCDAHLFGPESREIAGGYRLKQVSNPDQFALTIPYEDGGLIIDQIGWREPLILARAFGSQYWDVINTARAQHIRVSDLERKSDPLSQSIEIKSAQIAWKELKGHKRLW